MGNYIQFLIFVCTTIALAGCGDHEPKSGDAPDIHTDLGTGDATDASSPPVDSVLDAAMA